MMEYDIIEQMVELSLANFKLELKLDRAAGLLMERFGFDQCGIYLYDEDKRRFTLHSGRGDRDLLAASYGEGEGAAGQAQETGFAELHGAEAEKEAPGFKSVLAWVLRDRSSALALLILKSRKKTALKDAQRALLAAAAFQVVSVIRCDELIQGNEKIYGELIEIQTRMINTEKMMALGDMAATLAHEIRSPLISIGGFTNRLKKHLGEDNKALPYVEQMQKEVAKIEKIMDGIVRFLKDNAVEFRIEDINEVIEDSLRVFDEDIIEGGVRVIKDYGRGPLYVMADREQLKIAFDNLIANAIQSIERKGSGGTMVLSTGVYGESINASVSDDGGGVDPRYLAYIFNPFFTTKKHGTGLGLPITNSIILRHRGVVEILNREGAGVTFTVKLPFADKKVL